MRTPPTRLLLAVAGLLSALPALAQTTGRIEGRVTSESGGALAGATVTVSSPSLQGTRAAISAQDGRFRILPLPPGDYLVLAELDGFNPVESQAVRVRPDATITLLLALTPILQEQVVVVGESPTVDVTDTTSGADFDEELIETLPTGRSFSSLAFLAPGATSGGLGSPSIRGASAAENRYMIDGLDVTDVAYGTQDTSLPPEFVDTLEVKTGGYQAEYGGALGGFVNVVTKAGGNAFRGDVFGYYIDDNLTASGPRREEIGELESHSYSEVGFGLGGKLIADRLWFFAGIAPSRSESHSRTRQGIPVNPQTDGVDYAANLAWRLSPEHQLGLSAFGNPLKEEDSADLSAAGLIANDYESGTYNANLRYDATPRSSLLVEASFGHHWADYSIVPIRNTSPLYSDQTGTGYWAAQQGCGPPELVDGPLVDFVEGCVGGAVAGLDQPTRDQLRAAVSWFRGRHELKLGLDYREQEWTSKFNNAGPFSGPLVDELGSVVDPDGVSGSHLILFPDFFQMDVCDCDSAGSTDELGLFLQDRWQITPSVTLNLGLRFDSLDAEGSSTAEFPERRLRFDLEDMIAPRLGVSWDVRKNGRSELYASASRFFESVPLSVNAFAFGNDQIALHFFLYPSDGGLPTYENLGLHFFSFGFGLGSAVDPAVEAMYTDEAQLGFEYEVLRDLALGLRAVYRELGDVIEDISVDGGETYFVTNPGGTFHRNPVTGEPLDEAVTFPRAVREYRSLELTVNKRLRNEWQLYGSYVYSENEGNYGGLYRQDNSQLAPNLTSLFDLPELLAGAFGRLNNDRPHVLRVYGSYRWFFELTTGFSGSYSSGTPISKLGAHSYYGISERFVTPRGTAGRSPDAWSLSLHLEYPVRLTARTDLRVIADVFNVTNEQRVTSVDQQWTFEALESTEDPNECGGPGTGAGTDCPLGNPDWGMPRGYQSSRSVRFGLKLSW